MRSKREESTHDVQDLLPRVRPPDHGDGIISHRFGQQRVWVSSQDSAQVRMVMSRVTGRSAALRLRLWSQLRVRCVRHAPLWQVAGTPQAPVWGRQTPRRTRARRSPRVRTARLSGQRFVEITARSLLAAGRCTLRTTTRTERASVQALRRVWSSTGRVPSSWGPRDGADVPA